MFNNESYVDSSQNDLSLVLFCQAVAMNVIKGTYGKVFCTVIGFALELEADKFLGFHRSFLAMKAMQHI